MGCLKSKERAKISEVGAIRTTEVELTKDEDDNKLVNQYTIFKTIGRGSFGKVKMISDDRTNRSYAMKIMSKKTLAKKRNPNGTNALDDVMNEIKIMEKLNHANVVRIHEVIDDENHEFIYIIMEFCSRGKLMSIKNILRRTGNENNNDKNNIEEEEGEEEKEEDGELKREGYEINQVFSFFRDTLEGLEYLHQEKLIFHGDIKPENLLVTQDESVKISDFGVSKVMKEENEKIRSSSGTPSFQAPEIFKDEPYDPFKADIWALAISLYVLIYRQLPFESTSYSELGKKIMDEEVEFPKEKEIRKENRLIVIDFPSEEIQNECENCLKEMLIKDPEKRLSSFEKIREHNFYIMMEERVKKKKKRKSLSVK